MPTSPRERAAEALIASANPAVTKLVLRAIGPSSRLTPRLHELERSTAIPELKAMLRDRLDR